MVVRRRSACRLEADDVEDNLGDRPDQEQVLLEIGARLAGEMEKEDSFAQTLDGLRRRAHRGLVLDTAATSAAWPSTVIGLPELVNTPELRFDCPDARKFDVVDEVKARLRKAGAKFSDIDGVRVSTGDGWWLLRASNTQPVLVARCEAADEAGLGRLKDELKAELAASSVSLPDEASAGHH